MTISELFEEIVRILSPWLNLAALILSVVNAIALLSNYLRDRPRLVIDLESSKFFPIWDSVQAQLHGGKEFIEYGFVLYINVANKGLRRVSLRKILLFNKSDKNEWKEVWPYRRPGTEKDPKKPDYYASILRFQLPNSEKPLIESGSNIDGFARYMIKQKRSFMPLIRDDKIQGKLVVVDVFGNKKRKKVSFKKYQSKKEWEFSEKYFGKTSYVIRADIQRYA